jgi:hypothetical protein
MSLGRKCPEITGEKNGMFGVHRLGEEAPFYNHHHSEKTRKQISITMTGRKCPSVSKRNKENNSMWQPGVLAKITGEGNSNWQGGKSFELYGPEFNNTLKEQIRKRDNHQCQECGWFQMALGYRLPVHHKDFNKKNNDPDNLISLCRSCHTKINRNNKGEI